MNSVDWKAILEKEKQNCNQKVYQFQKEFKSFRPDDIAIYLSLFFQGIPFSEEREVLAYFDLFLEAIRKHFFRQLHSIEPKYFSILQKIQNKLPNCKIENFTKFSNVLSKIEFKNREQFLDRLSSLLDFIGNQIELDTILMLLYWGSGKPEVREYVYENWETLNTNLVQKLSNDLQIRREILESAFYLPENPKQVRIQFRTIPGYILFGGNFTSQPKLIDHSRQIFIQGKNFKFELIVDRMGSSLIPFDGEIPIVTESQIPKLWGTILEKKLPIKDVTSFVVRENFLIVTIHSSYNLFLFYFGEPK
ncbi:MAG: hypothetical protein O9301_02045 [Leptospira sp.]|nr:hypothetical protein [Leptospira sp.]